MGRLYNQTSSDPVPKVKAAGLGGLAITLLVAVLSSFGIVVPEDVSTAAILAIGSLATVASFVSGYLKRDRK